jgi:hypothetical protein
LADGNDLMPYTPGEKLVRWMNVYPKKGDETDVRFQSAVLFATKELADSFAVPGILACVRVTITIGNGLDELELAELKHGEKTEQ